MVPRARNRAAGFLSTRSRCRSTRTFGEPGRNHGQGNDPVRSLISQRGLTLVETLIALALLAILIVPATIAMQTAIVGSQVHSDTATTNYRLTSAMESLLCESYAALESAAAAAGSPTTASSYSEAPGNPARLVVYLSAWDGDNADADNDPFTGTDDGLIWIRVAIEGSAQSLETLRAEGQ